MLYCDANIPCGWVIRLLGKSSDPFSARDNPSPKLTSILPFPALGMSTNISHAYISPKYHADRAVLTTSKFASAEKHSSMSKVSHEERTAAEPRDPVSSTLRTAGRLRVGCGASMTLGAANA